MDIAGLLAEVITKHRNAMPLPNTPGAPSFLGIDVMTFLHKYESLAAFTATDITESNVISIFPFYCAEGSDVREIVMMMRGYADRDWTALKKELLDTFRHADSRALIYTRQHLEELCAKFTASHHRIEWAGFQNTDALKSFLRTFDHISGVVTERRIMCEYERTEMLLRALPKRLWRKAVTKLGMHPLEPSTFEYGKPHRWVTAKITAAEALAMFEFMAPKSRAATEMTPSTFPALTTSASTTPSASLTSASMTVPTAPMTSENMTTLTSPTTPAALSTILTTPTAPMAPTTSPALPSSDPLPSPASTTPVPLMTSGTPTTSPAPMTPTTLTAPTASVTPMAPTIFTTAHNSPAATDMTSTSSGTASPMTSTVPTAPTAFTPRARTHTARQGTICAGPTVRLGIIRVEPPQGHKVRRHHYVQPEPIRPHRTESTVTCRSEPAPSNRQMPAQPPQKPEPAPLEPVQPQRPEPESFPSNRRESVQQQQLDHPPCHYCANNEHNLRKCVELRMDLKKGIVSINNRDRLILGTAGAEIPMAPAARDFHTIRDYARAGAPILPPSPPSPPPARSVLSLSPPPPPPPAQSSRIPTPLVSPEQLTQLVREVVEHFTQPRPKQTARPPPAARKAQMLEQRRSICV
ncbi:hypothetical protein K440DRAFT_633369 [Wilcoxina mikolae CBS 423.85]|nr:hypothetical protein K440DRAFT_633369 [Wilcoxina mikolae CBS 423.85]